MNQCKFCGHDWGEIDLSGQKSLCPECPEPMNVLEERVEKLEDLLCYAFEQAMIYRSQNGMDSITDSGKQWLSDVYRLVGKEKLLAKAKDGL